MPSLTTMLSGAFDRFLNISIASVQTQRCILSETVSISKETDQIELYWSTPLLCPRLGRLKTITGFSFDRPPVDDV